jgi:hypothetical protein
MSPECIYCMNRIIRLSELPHLESVAHDIREQLSDPINQDLNIHFKGTVARYTGEEDEVLTNLEEARDLCETGKREQFIVFAGEKAVGMSIVTNQVTPPDGIDETWPNISGFICNPYRSLGLGRLSIQHRMKIVDNNFDGHAWTYVRKGNVPAEKIVLAAGFRVTDIIVSGQEHQNVFLYNKI